MDLVATVKDVIARVSQSVAASDKRPWEILLAVGALPGLESIDKLTFRHFEYELRFGLTKPLQELVNKLRWLSKLDIAAAPEVVELIPIGVSGIGEQSVLITRYRYSGERLLKAESTAAEGPFREDAVERLVGDMRKLVENGAMHPWVARGFQPWLVSNRSGALMLDGWSALRTCTPDQGAELLEDLAKRLKTRQPGARYRRMGGHRTRQVFGVSPVLLPVIHPIGWNEALKSVETARDAGVKGVFLIDQEMSASEVLKLVMECRKRFPDLWVGVNLLSAGSATNALRMSLDACEGRIDGIWADDAGIDENATSQPSAQDFIDARREREWTGLYFGCVAFMAAVAAAPYVDVICTSGPGTGQEAEADKVRAMRAAVGPDTALALASGVTEHNVSSYVPTADAFLVGTGIEEKLGVLDPAKLSRLQQIVTTLKW